MTDLLCGTAAASSETFRFVTVGSVTQPEPVEVRHGPGPDGLVSLQMEIKRREWDVTDPKAREKAGRELLGDDYDAHCAKRSAQWFIEPGRNAAGLAVFRNE